MTFAEARAMKRSLWKFDCNALRDFAVELGADRKRLYGTSKQSLILKIHELEKARESVDGGAD